MKYNKEKGVDSHRGKGGVYRKRGGVQYEEGAGVHIVRGGWSPQGEGMEYYKGWSIIQRVVKYHMDRR